MQSMHFHGAVPGSIMPILQPGVLNVTKPTITTPQILIIYKVDFQLTVYNVMG